MVRVGRARATLLAVCGLAGVTGCDAYGPTPAERPAELAALRQLNGAAPTGIFAKTKWKAMPSTSQARLEVSGVRIGKFAYIAGGIDNGKNVPTATLERYELATGKSDVLAPMPMAFDHIAVVAYKGDIYVAGGTSGPIGRDRKMHDNFFKYDVANDRWSTMPKLPELRGGGVGGVIGHKFYLTTGAVTVEGAELKFKVLSSTDIFDFKTHKWTKGPDSPTPRTHAAAAAVGGQLYVLGGASGGAPTATALKSVERFDPRTNKWTRLPDMPGPHNAFSATATPVDGKLFVAGGLTKFHLIAGSALFDPKKNTWVTLPQMRTPRHHFTAVAMSRRVFAIEGDPSAADNTAGMRNVEAIDVPKG